ncbi:hypothetical protein Tco_1274857 [Tanacetum coccineum]
MQNNSQVKIKQKEAEDHHRISSLSKDLSKPVTLQITKKPKEVPISTIKPQRKANQSIATPYKKTIALDFIIQKSMSYFRMQFENTNRTNHPIHRRLWMHKAHDVKSQAAVVTHRQGRNVRRNIMDIITTQWRL